MLYNNPWCSDMIRSMHNNDPNQHTSLPPTLLSRTVFYKVIQCWYCRFPTNYSILIDISIYSSEDTNYWNESIDRSHFLKLLPSTNLLHLQFSRLVGHIIFVVFITSHLVCKWLLLQLIRCRSGQMNATVFRSKVSPPGFVRIYIHLYILFHFVL